MALSLFISGLSIVALYFGIIQPYFFSPLSKIPNAHILAPLTTVWIQTKRYRGQDNKVVNQAFHRKGPIVRLGPNDIAVNTLEKGVKTVHGGGFYKPDWYSFWVNYGSVFYRALYQRATSEGANDCRYTNTFSALGNEHRIHRRRITNVYAKSFIQHDQQVRRLFHTILGRFISQIQESSQKGDPLDVLGLNMAYGLDFVSAFVFGLSSGTRFIQDVQARNAWLEQYLKSHSNGYMFWLVEMPGLRRWLEKWGVTVVPNLVGEARKGLERWGLEMVDKAEDAMREVSIRSSLDDDLPIVYNQLKLALAKERQSKGIDAASDVPQEERLQLASECFDHMVATRDVFGIAFTGILSDISSHPHIQEKLHTELTTIANPLKLPLSDDPSDLPSATELESLPLLNAIIKESLRLRGAQPVPNPRVTPFNEPTQIGPYEKIPGGVRVNCFAWCLHRNEAVFPDCESWRPERWLGGYGDRAEQEKWFWAFGSGSRKCLGDNLAMELMRYGVALIYTTFRTSIVPQEKVSVTMSKSVTGRLGDRLLLRLKRREGNEFS
ncbi:MAG: hypothetical protein Q9228_005330 [Teloschistes exilis]